MIKQVLQFVAIFMLGTTVLAQQVEQGPPAPQVEPATITVTSAGVTPSGSQPMQRACGTMTQDSVMRANNPEMPTLSEFEDWLQLKIAQESAQNNGVQSLPVVVHVIHNGESQGNGSNISQAQVQSQIEVLNEDFRRLNSDTTNTPAQWQGVAADAEIEFCLATVDESGSAMSQAGIDRVDRNAMGFNAPPYTSSYINDVIKPATIWDPTQYCNIWVLDIGGGILGYAQLPSQSGLPGLPGITSPNTDGVVVGYNYFGRGSFSQLQAPYNLGRTTTHEMGH
jgi:biopolymer transport protein ExbD